MSAWSVRKLTLEMGAIRKEARAVYGPNYRKQRKDLGPQAAPHSVMKRMIYSLVCRLINSKKVELLHKYADEIGVQIHHATVDNPFAVATILVFHEAASHECYTFVAAQNRTLFGAQMLHAYRHGVAPELLVGFIYQCGTDSELRRKLKEKRVELGWKQLAHTDF